MAEGNRKASARQEHEASGPPPSLLRIAEALLFVGGEPLTVEQARAAVRGLSEAQFREALDGLNQQYLREGRPYHVEAQGGGYVVALRSAFRGTLERLAGGTRVARLSPAAVDVLSLVAFRQPATRQDLDAVRGAECSNLLRLLVRRGLVAVTAGPDPTSREVAYVTTPRFLEMFGLRDLDELPRTEDLQRL